MWLLIIPVILLGALLWPLQLIAAYDAKGGRVYIRYGLFTWSLYPGEDKPTQQREEAEQKPAEPSKSPKEKLDGWVDILLVLKESLEPLDQLRQQIQIDKLILEISLTKDDPCDLAILYGRACGVVSELQVLVNRIFKVRRQKVNVFCDFAGTQSKIQVYSRISIPTVRLLGLILRYGLGIIKDYKAIKNRRKGGNTNEQKPS